jgi:hypothetical protein
MEVGVLEEADAIWKGKGTFVIDLVIFRLFYKHG